MSNIILEKTFSKLFDFITLENNLNRYTDISLYGGNLFVQVDFRLKSAEFLWTKDVEQNSKDLSLKGV